MDDLGQNTRLAVLMFTDIVESVRIKHRHGVAHYEKLIRRHDELFYEVLTAIPSVFCLKDTGDGFLSSFGTASEAVNAALRFQYYLSHEPWAPEPLRVRIGIHLGEVSELERDASGWPKLVGLTADIAARVMSLAEGGQVLLTRPVYDNARQYIRSHPSVDAGGETVAIEWKPHGRYVFKGSTEPMEIFEIGAVGLAPFTTPPDQEKARRVPYGRATYAETQQGSTRLRRVGSYVLDRKIDGGGASAVYRAEHRLMRRIVAMKAPQGDATQDPYLLQRFRREIETASRVNHPNIVTAHDAGEHRGVPYLVMEHVEGLSLKLITHSGGRLPVEQAVNCVMQAARGLAHAHRWGVVHRGIMPRHVLIDREGGVRLVGLSDARLMEDHGALDRHLRRCFPLTAAAAQYMAPELADEPNMVDPRSDIYSLGCLLYRLLTGRAPFRGEGAAEVYAEHDRQPIPNLSAELPGIPEGLQEVLVGMLAKTTEDRYQSMPLVIADLLKVVQEAPAHRLLLDATCIVSGADEPNVRAKRPPRFFGDEVQASSSSEGPIPIAEPRGT